MRKLIVLLVMLIVASCTSHTCPTYSKLKKKSQLIVQTNDNITFQGYTLR